MSRPEEVQVRHILVKVPQERMLPLLKPQDYAWKVCVPESRKVPILPVSPGGV
jgi:hypothetical protein